MILSNGLDKAGLRAHINPMSNEQQARLDAMADSYTFDLMCFESAGPAVVVINRDRAADSGLEAIRQMHNECDPLSAHRAFMAARYAARAAFRAVPALREGK